MLPVHCVYNFLGNRLQVVRKKHNNIIHCYQQCRSPTTLCLQLFPLHSTQTPASALHPSPHHTNTLMTLQGQFHHSFSTLPSFHTMVLNVDWTKVLAINTSHTPPYWTEPTSIHSKTVEQLNNLKHLGFTLDNKLILDQHITDIQTPRNLQTWSTLCCCFTTL